MTMFRNRRSQVNGAHQTRLECDCGYRSVGKDEVWEIAEAHVMETGHTVFVYHAATTEIRREIAR